MTGGFEERRRKVRSDTGVRRKRVLTPGKLAPKAPLQIRRLPYAKPWHAPKHWPTIAELRDRFVYDPERGQIISRKTGKPVGSKRKDGLIVSTYVRRNGQLERVDMFGARLAYALQHGEWPRFMMPNNGNPADIRAANLREERHNHGGRIGTARIYERKTDRRWVVTAHGAPPERRYVAFSDRRAAIKYNEAVRGAQRLGRPIPRANDPDARETSFRPRPLKTRGRKR